MSDLRSVQRFLAKEFPLEFGSERQAICSRFGKEGTIYLLTSLTEGTEGYLRIDQIKEILVPPFDGPTLVGPPVLMRAFMSVKLS